MKLFFGDVDEQPKGSAAVVDSEESGNTATVATLEVSPDETPTLRLPRKRTRRGAVGRPTDKVRSGLGKRVTAARKAKGMTQSQLAKRVGVNISTIRNVELGDSTEPKCLPRLKKVLGL